MRQMKTRAIRSAVLAAALMFASALMPTRADGTASPWPAGAEAYIISPADDTTVKSPVTVLFGLKGMGVAPAGVSKPKTGHHHLLIDADAPTGAELNDPLPADDTHIHFGGGQTQATVELKPGKHTLQLIMGDASHVPHDRPLVSKKITITVE